MARYCSMECATNAWEDHALECGKAKAERLARYARERDEIAAEHAEDSSSDSGEAAVPLSTRADGASTSRGAV